MNNYEERVLLKLKRRYGRDETVNLLNKKLSECQLENGILKSDNAELSHKLDQLQAFSKGLKEYKKHYRQSTNDETIINQRELIKNLESLLKALKIKSSIILEKYLKLQVDNLNKTNIK